MRRWMWAAAAAVSLLVGVGVAAWLHNNPTWGQPVESAAATAAALLTAVTAVAAAVAATSSSRAVRRADRALALHDPPRFRVEQFGEEGGRARLSLDADRPLHWEIRFSKRFMGRRRHTGHSQSFTWLLDPEDQVDVSAKVTATERSGAEWAWSFRVEPGRYGDLGPNPDDVELISPSPN